MAFGRVRNNKRSSNSSTSTIIILLFISICVLGVWLLSYENGVSPLSTTRTSSAIDDESEDFIKQDDKLNRVQGQDNPSEDQATSKDLSQDKNVGASDDVREKDRPSEDDSNENGEDKEKDSQVDESAQGLGGKDSSEEREKQDENQTVVVEDKRNEAENDQENNKSRDQSEERKDEPSTKDEKQNDENPQQQTGEEQQQTGEEQQQTGEEQQQTGEEQQEEGKTVTFKDETKNYQTMQQEENNKEETNETKNDQATQSQDNINEETSETKNDQATQSQDNIKEETNDTKNDQATQSQDNIKEETNDTKNDQATQLHDNTKEETNTGLEKDDTNQQEKSVSEKHEKEAIAKQEDSQQESEFTSQVNKQDTDQNTQSLDNKEETNTKQDNDDTNQQDKTTSQQQDKEAMTEQVDSQQKSDSTTQGDKQDVTTTSDKPMESNLLPNSGIPKESKVSKSSWATQAAESRTEKQRQKGKTKRQDNESRYGTTWKLCNVTAGTDYIPCLDNEKVVKQLPSINYLHFEHRERHCPEDPPTCLVPFPQGYKRPIQWPKSRDKIWFHNVPHTELAKVKGHQNWVKVSGEFLKFPGGGTQFIHGALHYIDFLEKTTPEIKWGRHTRVVLDIGCGVASFGGYLFEKDVLTMSFAPKDEHEAQIQFALERGIPAISAVMGSQRLPFPSGVFDIVHCARCRVPWHMEGGRLLLELNRVLRPGGFFIWSATPVYQKLDQDVEIWKAMSKITSSMCWKLEKKDMDKLNKVGAAIFRKPTNNSCYEKRQKNVPPMCKSGDDPNAAWYVPIQACLHPVPTNRSVRGSKWPIEWPKRLLTPPYWLNKSQVGVYGRVAPNDFVRDYKHWHYVVNKSYLTGLGIDWPNVRNVMDMRAVYGGFAAALRDLKIWVLNVVNVNAPDTLPIIYDRGLFGIYHDWCESFSTYPRTYDLLHADHLFSKLKERCKLTPVMAEIDRIVRPGGKLIVRDVSNVFGEVENLLKSLHWEVHLTFTKDQEGMLSATKTRWRPKLYSDS